MSLGTLAMIGLALALVGLTAAVHVLAASVTRQRTAAGLLASAQLPRRLGLRSFPKHSFGPARLAPESSRRRLHI